MKPLFRAVIHGCKANRHQDAFDDVYVSRMWRGPTIHFCTRELGAVGAELSALANFFESPWQRHSEHLSQFSRARVLRSAGFLLRAVGRLTEAEVAMQAGMDAEATEGGDVSAQAEAALYLSEISVDLGNLQPALKRADKAFALAKSCSHEFLQVSALAQIGCVYHQLGNLAAAEEHFKKAEETQVHCPSARPNLYSLAGFHFCAFLLDSTQPRMEWNDLRLHAVGIVRWSRKTRSDEGEGFTSTYPARDRALAGLMLGWSWVRKANGSGLGKASSKAMWWLDWAVKNLGKAGTQYLQPLALVYRARARFHIGRIDPALDDLNDAWEIAERGPMKLHLADIHLHRARLFFREEKYPWKSPAVDLAAAEKLINACGYHRRDEELADAKAALQKWDRR